MNYLREFGLPLFPALFEVGIRMAFIRDAEWYSYFNGSTFFVTFGIWSLVLALSAPKMQKIPGDRSIEKSRENFGFSLGLLSLGGLFLFCADVSIHAYVTGVIDELDKLTPAKSFFSICSLGYVIIAIIVIWLNKEKIESWYAN